MQLFSDNWTSAQQCVKRQTCTYTDQSSGAASCRSHSIFCRILPLTEKDTDQITNTDHKLTATGKKVWVLTLSVSWQTPACGTYNNTNVESNSDFYFYFNTVYCNFTEHTTEPMISKLLILWGLVNTNWPGSRLMTVIHREKDGGESRILGSQ